MAEHTVEELNDIFEYLSLNENAYFYKDNGVKSDNISKLFNDFAKNPSVHVVFKEYEKQFTVNHNKVVASTLVFKKESDPTCIKKSYEKISLLKEIKIAYVILIRVNKYVVIFKKNATLPSDFRELLINVPYNTMRDKFVTQDSVLKKMSITNLDVSEYAMRNKSMESNDLSISTSTFGMNSYYLNSFKVVNKNDSSEETMTLSLPSSRVNNNGAKGCFNDVAEWSMRIIDRIENGRFNRNSFISSLATCVYNSCVENYSVTHVLLLKKLLFEEIDKEDAQLVYGETFEHEINDYENLLNKYVSKALNVQKDGKVKIGSHCTLTEVYGNDKKYYLKNGLLKKIFIKYNERRVSVIDFINKNNAFIALFDHTDLRYANGMIFQDSQLKYNIESFLDLFVGIPKLNDVKSEKGTFPGKDATEFPENTIFRVVEDSYVGKYQAFICDDLGTEFADHIGIDQDRIALFVEKYGKSDFSASDFHVVVAQAQKNLGSYNFIGEQDKTKASKLKKHYKYSEKKKKDLETSIDMIRSANKNATDVINLWKNATKNIFLKKELFLVVNFISKDALRKNLLAYKRSSKNEGNHTTAKMILWLISSLAGSCKELNVEFHILCKP